MLTSPRDRAAAATGAAFVVLVLVGNQLAASGADALGSVVEFLGLLTLLPFLGYLLDAGRRAGGAGRGAVAMGTAALAGVTMLAIKLGSVVPVALASADRSALAPGTARVLNDANDIAFVLCWLPFAVFVGAAALGLHRSALVGRPTMVLGVVAGIAGLALGMLGLADPPNALPFAWLACLLWVLVVAVRLAVRPGAGTRAAGEPAATVVPAAA